MAGHEVEDTRTPCEVLLWDQEEKEAGYIYQVGFVTIILFLELLLRELPFLKRLQDWVPKSVLLIFVGLGWGGILKWQGDEPASLIHALFNEKVIFTTLLPPIILEAAINLYSRELFLHLDAILISAIVGTAFNVLAIGFSLYALFLANLISGMEIVHEDPDDKSTGAIDFLVFASILSAVDPVAVLSVFQALGVEKSLTTLILGESLFNDGVTIVFFECLHKLQRFSIMTMSRDYSWLGCMFASFVTTVSGGLLLGVIYGLVTALMCKITTKCSHNPNSHNLEMLIVVVNAYMAFVNAQFLTWSGIMALIAFGFTYVRYTRHNLCHSSELGVMGLVSGLAGLLESLLFIIFGMDAIRLFDVNAIPDHFIFSLWSLLFCLVYRAVSSFAIGGFLNWYNGKYEITLKHMLIMSWGGLRGAVSFVMALQLKDKSGMVQTATIFVILATCIVQGGTITPLVRGLKLMQKETEDKSGSEGKDSTNTVDQKAQDWKKLMSGLLPRHDNELSEWANVIDAFDRKHFYPVFVIDRDCRDKATETNED